MERKRPNLRDQDRQQERSCLACDIDIHCHTWTNMKLALRCVLQEGGMAFPPFMYVNKHWPRDVVLSTHDANTQQKHTGHV